VCGFIGRGQGVDKIVEVPFVFTACVMRPTGACSCVKRLSTPIVVESDSPIVEERRGRLAVPACLHKLFFLISGVLTPLAGVSTEG